MKQRGVVLRRSCLLLLVLIAVGFANPAEPQAQYAAGDSSKAVLVIKAILVAEDLALRPVPKRAFLVHGGPQGFAGERIVTDFAGEATITVPHGEYRVVSEEPLQFEGTAYEWDVSISLAPGEQTVLELSNDNAATQVIQSNATREVVLDEGTLYRVIKDGVVKVIAEGGHGSGFLVDGDGLILTNHHVVRDSPYLAVKIDDTHKYEAQLVAEDDFNDIAIIRVNPSVTKNLPILKIAEDAPDAPPVSVGERVLAIGSPLATETILTLGIVSKVEQGAIYSDVSINPGNSGGPLFNMRGEVIGINTFGLAAQSGPGVSGIVRIYLAEELLNQGKSKAVSLPLPSNRALPVESTFRFPAQQLRDEALKMAYNPKQYHLEAGQIDVQVMTPVVIANLEVSDEIVASNRQKKRSKKKAATYEAGKDFYNWRQYAGDYRPVVVIQAVPEIQLTGGSAFAVAMIGNMAHRKYRFKTDFVRMELVRDGTVIEPILPGKTHTVVSEQGYMQSFEDVGVYGRYEYPPEAFRPGANVVLKVWHSDIDGPKIKPLSPELLGRIWRDFKPYFESLQEKVAG